MTNILLFLILMAICANSDVGRVNVATVGIVLFLIYGIYKAAQFVF